jgi:hypothetical protein
VYLVWGAGGSCSASELPSLEDPLAWSAAWVSPDRSLLEFLAWSLLAFSLWLLVGLLRPLPDWFEFCPSGFSLSDPVVAML